MSQLILASSSPRRRRLLTDAGFEFQVQTPSDSAEPDRIEGTALAELSPKDLVAELARRKGEDVRGRVASPDTIVLAADTVAECRGAILGKPRDVDDARAMLETMSGQEHRVLTGFYLDTGNGDRPHVEVAVTTLKMAPLGDRWLEPYLLSGKWQGKAGAFGYQDGLSFVSILRGSESNVVGLPMERLTELLAERGCLPSRP